MGRINPTFIDNMGRHMGDVYGAVTDQILINLARYFPYYKPGQPVPQSSFEYQSVMLAQMGQVTQETINIIRSGLSDANSALQDVLQQAIMESVKKAQPDLLDAVNHGLLFPEKRPIISPEQMKAYWSYYLQASDKLNLVNTVMLESTRQAYQSTVSDIVNRIRATQNALDIGAGETITGVSSWNQAVKHAIDRMKTNGITGFIDHAGRRWNAESYVSMDVRTTLANTARAAVWETNQNFGNDLYQVSYHNGARPLCYPWQNKVISATNNARVVQDLDGNEIPVYNQVDTSYGAPAGLFGINCKHYPAPFIPGVSVIRGEPQNEEDNSRTYAESQQQRALERKIREEKRDLLMLKAQGAPDEMIRAQRARIRQTDDEIDAFCEQTGRARRQNREGVYTKRSFPDPETYDVALFEREQKELTNIYFISGGSQNNFTFGTMKPKAPTAKTVAVGDRKFADLRERLIQQEKAAIERFENDKAQYADKKWIVNDIDRAITHRKEKIAMLENGGYTVEFATKETVKNYVVNGRTTSEMLLQSADVYTMPDGVQFVFKHGMNKNYQSLTPDELIERYYTIPRELREKGQKTVAVVDRYNPNDAYWRKTYKNFRHSYMTGGETMTIYRCDNGHDMDYLVEAMRHEMGHNVDHTNAFISASQEWADAMAKDKAYSGGVAESVSEYGKNATTEDFAESVMKYTGGKSAFASAFPHRAAILERLIYGGN